jgi:hypothetical protein
MIKSIYGIVNSILSTTVEKTPVANVKSARHCGFWELTSTSPATTDPFPMAAQRIPATTMNSANTTTVLFVVVLPYLTFKFSAFGSKRFLRLMISRG